MIFADFLARLFRRACEPVTPHPDRLIEAQRDYGDAYDDDDEIREVNVIATLVLIVILVAGVVLFFSTASASGPGCPGMDPSWLGWCEQVKP